ncbi:MAG TPA: DUF6250 domain-containing protein [Opitutaceae bacterium]|nr:DUF6250 domain-containing protein [Opitutaceae bacterium]
MRSRRSCVIPLLIVLAGLARPLAGAPAALNRTDWVIEEMPGGHVTVGSEALVIDDVAGCTVWYRPKLTAPVEISYDVTVVAHGGPNDRVSDVNCFWMATDPRAPEGCPFAAGHGRSGRFTDYDSLQTYYVGMGGNTNSTTRFRRYGHGTKPLLPQYDRRDSAVLLQPNHTYHIRVVMRDGKAEYWRDGVNVFTYADPHPLTSGWFAFRTVKSHLEIRNFHVGH